jgi:hypothetical protein
LNVKLRLVGCLRKLGNEQNIALANHLDDLVHSHADLELTCAALFEGEGAFAWRLRSALDGSG